MPRVGVRQRADQERADRVDDVAHARDDLVAIRGEDLNAGDPLELLVEIGRFLDEPFDHGLDVRR